MGVRSISLAPLCATLYLACLLAGCSTPASREGMVPQHAASGRHFAHSINVQASGGNDTGALDSSNISDGELKAAIEEAIVRQKLFAGVIQGNGGDYTLNVRVISLTKPLFGTTFTVELEMAWSLVRNADRHAVLRKSIKSSGSATMGDAFAALTRLRLAVEAAARANIESGLREISTLNL